MLIPEMLFGDAKAVMAACSRHITRFKGGASWVAAGAMIDVQQVSGLIMVGSPSPLLAHGNIRLCTPFLELDKAVGSGRITFEASIRAFDEALGHPWSVLGLLSPVCYSWLRDSERADRFLKAMIAHWAEIDAVGPRSRMHSKSGKGCGSFRFC